MDAPSLALAFLGWFIGGITGGAAGMGAGMIALPIMAMHMDVRNVVVATLVIGTFSSGHLFLSYRKHAKRRDLQDFLTAAVPFCLLGTLLLRILPKTAILISIAVMILAFVILKLFFRSDSLHLPDKRWAGLLAGAVTGLCQGANSMSGPPLAIYVLLKKWDPDRARGNMSVIFILICIPTLIALVAEGMLTRGILFPALSGLAGMAIGQPLGVRIGRTMSRSAFERLLLCLLVLAAASLAAKAAMLF